MYLLGIETPQQLAHDPAFGGVFENMVVVEAVKKRLNSGKDPNIYFFRDRSRNEVDLLYPESSFFRAIEIKSSGTFRTDFTKGIHYFQELSGTDIKGILAYDGDLETETDHTLVRNFRNVF